MRDAAHVALPSRGRAGALLLVASLALGAAASGARADDAAESRFYDAIARDAYAHHRYPDALAAFLRAHRAAPSSRSLYNIALCAQLARREAMSFAYFAEFLRSSSAEDEAPLRADATSRTASLRRLLAIVSVTSDPPGATIYVDQRDHGSFGTTPRMLALPAGAHHLELVLADHEGASIDVSAVVGEVREATGALVPHRGGLTVTTSAPDATVTARRDGEPDALPVSAGARVELPVGHYTLTARAPGHRDATAEVTVVRGGEERRALTLEALPVPVGRLLVTTGDVHARVRVDGSDRAETPARVEGVGVGTHEVSVTADGYLAWSGTVRVEQDRTAFVGVTLVRAR